MKILAMIVLGAIYSGSSILILFFINKYLLTLTQKDAFILISFFGLLAAFLISSILSRIALSAIGHNFVFDMRMQVIKRILDTPNQKIAAIGKSNLLASLSSDIISLTNGFTRIPDIIQGSLIVSFASFYIAYLSYEIFIFLLIWMSATIFISNASMKNIYKYYGLHRQNEDTLYKDYQTSIEGHRELSLNLERSKRLYNDRFIPNAKDLRSNIIKAEIYSSFASNWIGAMMLGAIGVVIYICLAYKVASLQDSITIALTILFLRAPIMMVVSSIPSLFKSKIAFEKLKKLDLNDYEAEFSMSANFPQSWDKLSLKNINFRYSADDEFALNDISFEINRGEVVFLIGKNGSGKSTLFMILAGLLEPNSGDMYVDDVKITKENLRAYSNTISAIFSDFYLFDEVLSSDDKLIDELLKKMILDKKVSVKDDKFSTLNLSQGQRKRLAMVAALLEKRKFIILDEWAADQDPQFRKMFYNQILRELKKEGYTVFAISHDDAYFDCADKIYSIENGKLSQIK
ncbi:cyclic peptide export ABC transporter [Campylobacter sp.]|uniref:cyclic peptide export ABC transporter n=1 Tax=Campylobacter sp. TaxID=205 RepID=UPI00403E5426